MTERLWLTSYSQWMTGQTQTYPAPVCQGGTSRALLQRLVLISPSSSSNSCLPSGGDFSLRKVIGVSTRTLTPAPARPTSVLESSPGSSVQRSSRAVCTACHKCRMSGLRIGTNPVEGSGTIGSRPNARQVAAHISIGRLHEHRFILVVVYWPLSLCDLRLVGTDSPVTIADGWRKFPVGGASEASQFGRTLCFSSAGSQLEAGLS
jgi:hypothetical protein